MFRFAELFCILILLYLIANFLHYIINRTSSDGEEQNWLFGLSNEWIKNETKKEKKK